MIQGIDISHWEPLIDWNKLGVDYKFAFIKASQGILEDSSFDIHWESCPLPRGAYHFYYPWVDPKRQAEFFWNLLGDDPGELPFVLDIEAWDPKYHGILPYHGWGRWYDFLERLKVLSDNKEILIYTSWGYWDKWRPYEQARLDYFKQYSLWVANYGALTPKVPLPWTANTWTFWQYSESGIMDAVRDDDGTLTNVDLNWYNGDEAQFIARFGLGNEPAPEPPPVIIVPEPVKYTGKVVAPLGVNVRSAPLLGGANKVGAGMARGEAVEGVDIIDSAVNQYRWLRLTDNTYIAIGTQDGREVYVQLAGDLPEMPQIPQSQGLWRVRHEKPPRETGFPNPPEIYPAYVSPNMIHGTARTRLRANGWEPYFRWLLGNDEQLFQYAIGPALVMFNKQARDDWENGGDAMESLWFGGTAVTGEVLGAWLKVKTMNYQAGPPEPYRSYWDDPLAVQKAVTVNSKTGRIDPFPLKGNPPKPTYYPLVCSQDVYLPMKWLEPFPSLPMQAQVTALPGLIERAAPDQKSARVGSYMYGQGITILEYRLHGSEVWGRTESGWVALYWPYNWLFRYLTSWRMETDPAPV